MYRRPPSGAIKGHFPDVPLQDLSASTTCNYELYSISSKLDELTRVPTAVVESNDVTSFISTMNRSSNKNR